MNYITEILRFQEIAQDKSLSSGQIALWYALMYINNRSGWTQWFTVAASSLELNSGLSRQGVIKSRNALKQCGLIDFKTNGTKATSYRMMPTSESVQDGLQVGIQNSVQSGLQVGIQNSSALYKPNETKPNKENIKEGSRLSETLDEFADMRKKIKKPLTGKAMELIRQKLDKLAAPYSDKEGYMVQSLEQSILNGWQGVFEVKGFIDKPAEPETLPDSGPKLFNPGDSIEDYL